LPFGSEEYAEVRQKLQRGELLSTGNRLSSGPSRKRKASSAVARLLDTVPSYVVVNDYGEMVVASRPPTYDRDTLETPGSALGLYFLNRDDAAVYKEDVQVKDAETTKTVKLHVRRVPLSAFYRRSRRANPEVAQFHLVPDLSELQRAARPKSPMGWLWGHKQFKGTPVFVHRQMRAWDKNEGRRALFTFTVDVGNKEKQPIFFNKKAAVRAWRRFRKEEGLRGLPRNLPVQKTSLENFMEAIEGDEGAADSYVLLASPEAFDEVLEGGKEDKGIPASNVPGVTQVIRFVRQVPWYTGRDMKMGLRVPSLR